MASTNYQTVVGWDTALRDVGFVDSDTIGEAFAGLAESAIKVTAGAPAAIAGQWIAGAQVKNAFDGTTWTNVGTTAVPSWTQFGGGGSIGGTIAANQIGFGSALNTLAGDPNFTWDPLTGQFDTSFAGNSTLLIAPQLGHFAFGFYTGGGNGAYLDIVDMNYIKFTADSGDRFRYDMLTKTYQLGDINNQDNGTVLTVDDNGQFINVNRDFTVSGHSAFGPGTQIDTTNFGLFPIVVNVGETVVTDVDLFGVVSINTLNPVGAYTSISTAGMFRTEVTAGNVEDFTGSSLTGTSGTVRYAGTDIVGSGPILSGGSFESSNDDIGITAFTLGVQGNVYNNSTGNIGIGAGGLFNVENELGGTINVGVGVAGAISNNGVGTFTAAATFLALAPSNTGGGTMSFVIGMDIKDHSGIGAIVSHNFLSEGLNSTNLFEGSVWVGGFMGVGVPFTSEDPSAKMQIDSTTQGFLPPRMTEAERLLIGSPADGLIVFQTDVGGSAIGIWCYYSGMWNNL